MRKGQALAIGKQFSLPPTRVSRHILKGIANGQLDVAELLPEPLRERVRELRTHYQRKLKVIDRELQPRNLPYYLLIKEMYPGFHWIQTDSQIQIETYFRGFKPNLLSYLLGLIPHDQIATTARIASLAEQGLTMRWLEQCKGVFEDQRVCKLSDVEALRLQRWIEKGLRGERLTIVSPVCPDYSAAPGESRKYRFTFESVGTGVGLACARLFESLPALRGLFSGTLGLAQIEHRILVGDFEAFGQGNCRRVGLSSEAFVERMRASTKSILAAAPAPVSVGLFTDICGGRDGWTSKYDAIQRRYESGAFGPLRGNPLFRDVACARKALYQRWHDAADASDEFFEGLVVAQAVEYSTMGKVIEEQFVNPLVIGADHHRMAPFYNFAADIPVLYLDRNYD